MARQETDREPSGFPHPATLRELAAIECFGREKDPSIVIFIRRERLDCYHECGPPLLFKPAISSFLFPSKRET